ncbi:GerMN domain-containing protein [Gulosibacter sp. 10]|uniref:GerMN domain-containing protein n=1 Tax=Gulosibacter sp. 10 TaxID=1255570 RepID=UPI00097EE2B7|nr:GerMN domain-containing protein [Gulosibacter sp. 10]SJM54409.1 LpqB [Gulosibacter sp. 10]
MTRFRRACASVLAAALVTVLAACAQIPLSGSVEQGEPQEAGEAQSVRYYPDGPFSGATQEEIVLGFIDAGTGAQNDFATAREFLTDEAAESWRPEAGVLLMSDGQVSSRAESDTEVVVSVPINGTLDEHGFYQESPTSSTKTLEFRLEMVGGEWRIAEAPDGIVLIRQAFTDLYGARPLTFFDGAQQFTASDLRWFLDDSRAATRMVEELIAGPAEWMLPGESVTSAFPANVELVDAVRINGQTAVVNFSDSISNASPGALSLMRLQLEESLTQLDGVASVEMQVNGAKLDVALPASDEVIRTADVNPSPLVQQDGTLGYLSGGTLEPPVGSENAVAEVERLNPIRGAVSASRGTIALLTSEGTYGMSFEDESATFIDARGGQVEPALDNWDWVWTQSTTQTGLYITRIGEYQTLEIRLPDEVSDDFISHQVSRDGTKIAFLYDTDEGVELAVSPIIRDETGMPITLGDPLVLGVSGDQASDVAWVDGGSVAMLVDGGEGTTEVQLYRLGGEFTMFGSIPNAMQVAGSNTLQGMRVVDRQGTLYAPRTSRWQAASTTITFLYAQV